MARQIKKPIWTGNETHTEGTLFVAGRIITIPSVVSPKASANRYGDRFPVTIKSWHPDSGRVFIKGRRRSGFSLLGTILQNYDLPLAPSPSPRAPTRAPAPVPAPSPAPAPALPATNDLPSLVVALARLEERLSELTGAVLALADRALDRATEPGPK
jgi:hypothetical protein